LWFKAVLIFNESWLEHANFLELKKSRRRAPLRLSASAAPPAWPFVYVDHDPIPSNLGPPFLIGNTVVTSTLTIAALLAFWAYCRQTGSFAATGRRIGSAPRNVRTDGDAAQDAVSMSELAIWRKST
jgi:hypothetical protein